MLLSQIVEKRFPSTIVAFDLLSLSLPQQFFRRHRLSEGKVFLRFRHYGIVSVWFFWILSRQYYNILVIQKERHGFYKKMYLTISDWWLHISVHLGCAEATSSSNWSVIIRLRFLTPVLLYDAYSENVRSCAFLIGSYWECTNSCAVRWDPRKLYFVLMINELIYKLKSEVDIVRE